MRSKLPEISSETFFNHVDKFYKTWTNSFSKQYDVILVVSSKSEKVNSHSEATLGWLFGFNLTPTILLFTKKSIIIYTSENKLNFLAPLKDSPKFAQRNVIFIKREKQAESNEAAHAKLVEYMEEGNKSPKVGTLSKPKNASPQEFEVYIKQKEYKTSDVLPLLNECMVVKDHAEVECMQKSAQVTAYFYNKMVDNILHIIDNEQTVTHLDVATKVEAMLDSENELRKAELNLASHNVKKDFIDNICNGPAIQSGGTYEMKLLPEPNKENLKVGCIILGFGCKYKLYNTFVSRTLLIGKSQNYQALYVKVAHLHKQLITAIEAGKKVKDVYKKGVAYIKSDLPSCEVPNNFGYGIGLEFKESSLTINDTNQKVLEPNMTLLVTCGFKDLKGSSGTFAVQLSDVVLVNEKGPATVLTENDNTKKSFKKIFWQFGDSDDKKKQENKKANDRRPVDMPVEGRRRRNQKSKYVSHTNLKERNEHQQLLKQKKLEELKLRLNDNFSGNLKKIKQVDYERLECYKNREELPKDIKKNKIYVDGKNNSLLLPINGVMVPFNVNVLKNIVKFEQGKFIALRFNFHTPVGGLLGNIKLPELKDPTIFVKELTYRSENTKSLAEVYKSVKDLQRKLKNQADEQKNKEEIIDQEKLQLNKNKKPLLKQLGVKPNLVNKKAKGTLECHFNGFRYTAQKGQIVDVIFSNIKHAFIQPPEESIAAIHFRLHHPIMIGKKKTEDVQFYAEVGGVTEDVEKYRRGEDDSDDEELIRAARKKLEKELTEFAKACEEYSKDSFEFQVPVREMGFTGTPYKASSLLQPTKNCLVNLIEQPFFVLNIDDIEIAWFERMFANLSSFDLTFVFKDFERFIRVQAIPIEEVEKIKDWLDKSNIIFCDIQRIFDWSKFLQPIRSNFKAFVDDGAWLAWDSQSEEEEGDSAYEEQQDDDQSSESSESDYEEQADNDSGSYDAEQDLSEEGLSSEEMERRLEEEDNRKKKKEMQKERAHANPKKRN